MVKLSILLVTLVTFAFIDSSLAGGGQVQVTKNVLDSDECEAFTRLASRATEKAQSHGPRLQSFVSLSLDLASRLYQAMHPCRECTCSSGTTRGKDVKVVTSTIRETTPFHQDHYRNGKLASERVGFVVLNDNPDATFVYGYAEDGDSEEQQQQVVPIQKGSLVTFQGDVPHHTIVPSGQVHLLGPFSMTSFLPVGDDDDGDGGDEDCSVDCFEACGNFAFVCRCLRPGSRTSDGSARDSTCSSKGSISGSGCNALCSGGCNDGECIGDCRNCPDGEFSCECNNKTSKSSKRTRKLLANAGVTRSLSSKGLCGARASNEAILCA